MPARRSAWADRNYFEWLTAVIDSRTPIRSIQGEGRRYLLCGPWKNRATTGPAFVQEKGKTQESRLID